MSTEQPLPAPGLEPAAAVVETAAVPAVETPVAAEPEKIDHAATPSLLTQAELPSEPVVKPAAPVEEKPAAVDAKPAEPVVDAKPAEPAAPAAPAPIEYPAEWKLPEGVTADKETLGKYTDTLKEFGVTPEAGQKILDMHAAAMQQYAEKVAADQHRIFSDIRTGWQNQVLVDPEIGGNGHQTAMGVIARVRDRLVSTHEPGTEQYKKDRAEFDNFVNMTGAGDHPIMLKIFYRAGRYLDEPKLPPVNIGPSPNGGRPSGKLRDAYTTMKT